MTRELRRVRRASFRAVWLIGPILVIFVVIGLVRHIYFSPTYRQAVVLVGNGLHVASYDSNMGKVTVMDLPADLVIPTAMGYGQYAVRSVISLDSIDHLDGALIMASVERALGIPIFGHVIISNDTDKVLDAQVLRRVFSYPSIGARAAGKIRTSLSVIDWVRFVVATQRLASDAFRSLTLVAATVDQPAADGGRMAVLDTDRADYLLGTELFDAQIRSEGLTVALYNTTDVQALGGNVSRILSRMGLQMVFVGNADQDVVRCRITGRRDHLATKTALFIQKHFGCETSEESMIGNETGADLVVLIGNEYASRYKASSK